MIHTRAFRRVKRNTTPYFTHMFGPKGVWVTTALSSTTLPLPLGGCEAGGGLAALESAYALHTGALPPRATSSLVRRPAQPSLWVRTTTLYGKQLSKMPHFVQLP